MGQNFATRRVTPPNLPFTRLVPLSLTHLRPWDSHRRVTDSITMSHHIGSSSDTNLLPVRSNLRIGTKALASATTAR
jgi:hypothetical protein